MAPAHHCGWGSPVMRGLDPEDADVVAAGNQLATIAREIITGVATGERSDMWSLVYGHLHDRDDRAVPVMLDRNRSNEQLVAAFVEQYNALNLGAMALITALAQLYAGTAGITEIEAIDRAQALMHAGFEI
ncbi:hypothetical protein ACSNN7_06185 [Micromonospora sp. URMC 105]|uniref:hypothetical protein n=1 Tax=Micromonospora sp. URMC 105 TaxID=3423413 RepID=UPI003F1BC8A5